MDMVIQDGVIFTNVITLVLLAVGILLAGFCFGMAYSLWSLNNSKEIR